MKGTKNSIKNNFTELGENQTKWKLDSKFEFGGIDAQGFRGVLIAPDGSQIEADSCTIDDEAEGDCAEHHGEGDVIVRALALKLEQRRGVTLEGHEQSHGRFEWDTERPRLRVLHIDTQNLGKGDAEDLSVLRYRHCAS